jgi:hypothetical protein
MTAEIIRLADRRPPMSPAAIDRPAAPATILALPLRAVPAERSALASGNAAAAALTAACRDLTASLTTIHQRAAAIRERMDALDRRPRSVMSSGDTIVDASRGGVAKRRALAQESVGG